MKKIILVFGLPGSGKTTFSEKLKHLIPEAEHINADNVRQLTNDWDFSDEGRLRQCYRMKKYAEESTHDVVILDFVCPRKSYRDIINADISFFINRIKTSRFEDTNALFEYPDGEDVITIN